MKIPNAIFKCVKVNRRRRMKCRKTIDSNSFNHSNHFVDKTSVRFSATRALCRRLIGTCLHWYFQSYTNNMSKGFPSQNVYCIIMTFVCCFINPPHTHTHSENRIERRIFRYFSWSFCSFARELSLNHHHCDAWNHIISFGFGWSFRFTSVGRAFSTSVSNYYDSKSPFHFSPFARDNWRVRYKLWVRWWHVQILLGTTIPTQVIWIESDTLYRNVTAWTIIERVKQRKIHYCYVNK